MTHLNVEGTRFTFDDISINSLELLEDGNFSYTFLVSCHGSELDREKSIILNEGCKFDTIALGNRFGHFAYTSAHRQKAIPLHESDSGNEIIEKLRAINQNFNSDINQQGAVDSYYINDLTTELLPNAKQTEKNGEEILYSSLNPMEFLIKKSDYEGYNKEPSSKEFINSQEYINEFGLWLYKCYKFKGKLNNEHGNRSIDLDIAVNKRQLKGFYNIPEIHSYFSNTNRNIDELSLNHQELIKTDIRSYMEPDQKCTWNTLINMCYDTIAELQPSIENIYDSIWNLRVLCCRATPGGNVASSTTQFVQNRDIINYVPELINDNERLDLVPYINNFISNEHIDRIFTNLENYLNYIYNAFRFYQKSGKVHFITSHPELLLVFQLLTISYPINVDITDNIVENINFRKFLFRIHTITIENSQYDLFECLITLIANNNSKSKRYSRKKISLLGNPTNNFVYMQELLYKLQSTEIYYTGQERLIECLNLALNGEDTENYSHERFIIDNIIMLSKKKNFMDDYNEDISIIDESDEDAMSIEDSDYLTFTFKQAYNIDTLIDNSDYLGLLGDSFFNSAYIQFEKYIINESEDFNSHICMYFTAAKDINEDNEKIEEAVFVFILDISEAFTKVESYLIGLNIDNFMNSEQFAGVKWKEDYSERILNKENFMFKEKYEENSDIKILINYIIYYGCIIPLYRKQFNYIDLIYRDRDTMTGGGPKIPKIPKKRTFIKNYPTIDLDKKPEEEIPEPNYPLNKISELDELGNFKFENESENPNFSSNDNMQPKDIDNIFPIFLKDKELGTPRDQGITESQPDSQGSDIIFSRAFSPPASPESTTSSRRARVTPIKRGLPLNKSFPSQIPELPSTDNTPQKIPAEKYKKKFSSKSAPSLNVVVNDEDTFKLLPGAPLQPSPSMIDLKRKSPIQRDIEGERNNSDEFDIGMDIEKPKEGQSGGKKRKSKKLKVKRKNGKTKKKSVKKN